MSEFLQQLYESLSEFDELYQKLDNLSVESKSDIVEPVYKTTNQFLNEEREAVCKLEKELLESSQKEADLIRTVNEAISLLDTHQQKLKECQELMEKQNQEHKNLLSKMEATEENIRIETDNETGTEVLCQESLKTVIFRQMGVNMIVNNDYKVKKCVLTNGQEVRTVPLDKYNNKQILKVLWEFICKDV